MSSESYYRTTRGNHVHADWSCANWRRDLQLGDVITMTEAESLSFAPCAVCNAGQAAAHAAMVTDTMCRNPGVDKPNRIQSTCKECGKLGTVVRGTSKLRAHKL